jgi:hypothetical protein
VVCTRSNRTYEQRIELSRALSERRNGTTELHRPAFPLFRNFAFTDGVKYLADEAQAYWLTDAIFSHQSTPEVSREDFQLWKLARNPQGHGAVLIGTDGDKGYGPVELARQEFWITDFPLPEIELYFYGNVLMLPAEYRDKSQWRLERNTQSYA